VGRGRGALSAGGGKYGARGSPVIEPLRMSFEVECPVAHAFDVWTNKISR
jgi:hypothetical protein